MTPSDLDDMFVSVPSDNATYTASTLGNNVVLRTFYSFLVISLIIYLVKQVYGYYAIKSGNHK